MEGKPNNLHPLEHGKAALRNVENGEVVLLPSGA